MKDEGRHPLDLAFGCALALISAIDFYTARSLSLVAYVEPHLVKVVQTLEVGVSIVCALGVATVIATWALLARHARYRPEQQALVFESHRLTFDRLNRRVNRLANALLATGLTKGDKVATVLPNCLEQIEVYCAVAKTGLVAVPLSPLLQEAGLVKRCSATRTPRWSSPRRRSPARSIACGPRCGASAPTAGCSSKAPGRATAAMATW